MKKVFSKAKWMERYLSLGMKEEFLLELTWPDECEGLTEEEMNLKRILGFVTRCIGWWRWTMKYFDNGKMIYVTDFGSGGRVDGDIARVESRLSGSEPISVRHLSLTSLHRRQKRRGGVVTEIEKYYAYDDARSIILHALSRISDLTSDSVIESIKDDLEGNCRRVGADI